MRTRHLAEAAIVIIGLLTLPAGSPGQSVKRDDSLKPFTSCSLKSGLRIVQVDRLPEKSKERTVRTSKGDEKISMADGYRVMVAYNDRRDWFANIKVESSVAADYETNKQKAIENLKWAASTTNELQHPEPVKISINGHDGYETSKRSLNGSMLGIYLFFYDADRTIMTIYFINQNANRMKFQTIEEWRAVRDEFLDTYTTCVNNGRNQL